MNKRLQQIIILLGDFSILNLSLFITIAVRYHNKGISEAWAEHWPYFLPIFLIWILVFYIGGVYNLNLIYNNRRLNLIALNSTISSALLSIVYFYLNRSIITPKTNLIVFSLITLITFITWRLIYAYFIKAYLPKNNLALIGWNKQSEILLDSIKNQVYSGYETALIFKSKEDIKNLPILIREKNIHTLVITTELFNDQDLNEVLFDCLPLGVTFFSFHDFYEHINGQVPIESINQSWFIKNIDESNRGLFNFIKRAFDFIMSVIIISISFPFLIIIALVIKLESNGPVFFQQKRVGKNETVFNIVKFRTMKTVGNDGAMTSVNDSRITKFGSFLRKSRLDEIPQTINIIKGEMSFIGPRPERPEFISELSTNVPFYKTRLLIKPGITGWDQVSGEYHSPSIEDTIKKLQHDLFYLKNRSLYLDFTIILKTITTVLSRQGR